MSIAVGTLVVGTDACWQEFREDVVKQRQLLLTPERVTLNSPPTFYPTRFVQDLQQQIADGNPSLLDPQLLKQVVTTVEKHPSVHTVASATKNSQGVQLEIDYRVPVAMLEIVSNRFWIIDQTGTILAADVTAEVAPQRNLNLESILRVELPGLRRFLDQRPGQLWQDEVILQAAKISQQIRDRWPSWGVYQLVCFCPPEQSPHEQAPWELWTRNGAKVIWANSAHDDGIPWMTKAEALTRWIAENGPLSQVPLDQAIDLRDGSPKLIPWHRPIR